MYGADGRIKDTKAVNPESTFSRIYQEIINFCKTNGPFDPATMGTVPNVGLMAQKAEEYGSHDKTFEIPEDGVANIVDLATGEVLLTQNVEAGDIWRMCVRQGRADPRLGQAGRHPRAQLRHAGGVLAGPVPPARERADQEGPHLPEGPRHRGPRHPDHVAGACHALHAGARDPRSGYHRRDRQHPARLPHRPVPDPGAGHQRQDAVHRAADGRRRHVRNGRGRFGAQARQAAGGGEPPALGFARRVPRVGASLEDLGIKTGNKRAKLLATTLDAATGKLLDNNKGPSRKTGELDNRGSQFYLAMYWAQELAAQTEDKELADHFAPLAKTLSENEDAIVQELAEVRASRWTSAATTSRTREKTTAVMRPSETFNAALAAAQG